MWNLNVADSLKQKLARRFNLYHALILRSSDDQLKHKAEFKD